MSSHQSEVKTLLDEWSEAIRRKDIERLMSVYAPSIVYFDVAPPLRFVGLDAVRRNFVRWFDMWSSGIGVELRDRRLCESRDLAASHLLHRTSGTLKAGRDVDYWLRVSVWCERTASGWRIAHEHVSLPVDFAKGTILMDLQP
jgi:ketosteroid isomerase-like protein